VRLMKKSRAVFLSLAALVVIAGCAASPSGRSAGTVVRVEITDEGFRPRETFVPAGEPVTVEFTRLTDQTCATEVVFASLGVRRELPLHQTVRVPIRASAGDTLHFACGMDMYRGTLVAR
jgi:plastocyanin domain-containing protein